ncbi:hypothetical protein ACFFWC_26400 [Plantactinospora siamensis]|uniref:Uncharacterized protein n=1 Tax=Plantactinospora siamensis TaxID=555372 RepID=A0ABV6NZH4_9ACTN
MRTSAPAAAHRRPLILALLTCLALGSGVGLAVGLAAPAPRDDPDGTRPLTAAEARRLGAMWPTNLRDGTVVVHATLNRSGRPVRLGGWVDWRRRLGYLAVDGPGAGPDRGLVQAAPGVLAHRPPPVPAGRPGLPPPAPPADGWQVRRLAPAARDLDALLALLFGLATDRDGADMLARVPARWLKPDRIDGLPVDVLLGPALPEAPGGPAGQLTPAPSGLAELGGPVRYWLDRDARLHRLEATLPGAVPARVDLDRPASPEMIILNAIDALGGDPVRPRAVTDAEADRLARMSRLNRARGGARVTLALPSLPDADLRGSGWFDWRRSVAYLALTDAAGGDAPALVRADPAGVARREGPLVGSARPRPAPDEPSGDAPTGGHGAPAGAASPAATRNEPAGRTTPGGDARPSGAASPDGPDSAGADAPPGWWAPPLPAPADGWTVATWRQRIDDAGGLDLDLLLSEGLAAGRRSAWDAATLRASAVWLRADSLRGRPVSVFEVPKPAEAGEPPGSARLRYWLDRTGLLCRVELRTRSGAYAQLDLAPGRVPRLPLSPET